MPLSMILQMSLGTVLSVVMFAFHSNMACYFRFENERALNSTEHTSTCTEGISNRQHIL